MIINTSQVVVDMNGNPYKDGDKELTVGFALGTVLSTVKSTDPLLSKILTDKVIGESETEINATEATFVIGIVKQSGYIPYIQGCLIQILDGNAKTSTAGSKKDKAA